MAATSHKDIKDSLTQLYAEEERPWLVGFSGGKDSTMLASLIFEAVLSIPPGERNDLDSSCNVQKEFAGPDGEITRNSV